MPINLKHSGNATPALVGAYAGGEGERGAKDAPVLSKLYGERAAQTSRQASAMMSQLKQSADARQQNFLNFARQRMSERQREIDRRDDIARADAIRAENRQNFLDDRAHAEERQDALRAAAEGRADALRAEELARAEADRPADQFDGMVVDNFLPQLTREEYDADREGYNRLFAQWRAVGADDGLTDDEKLAARQELSRQFYGLQTAPRPPADPTPQERFERDTFEWQGARYGFDKSGKVYQVPAAPVAGGAGAEAGLGHFGMPMDKWMGMYSKVASVLGRAKKPTNPDAVSDSAIRMLRLGGYLDDETYNAAIRRSVARELGGGDPGHNGGPSVLTNEEKAALAKMSPAEQERFYESKIDELLSTTDGDTDAVPPPSEQPAASDPLAAVEAGWSATLAQEQGAAPAGGSGAEPPVVVPEPSPTSPAPTPSPRPLVALADGSPGIRLPDGTEVPWVPNIDALAPPPSLTPARKRR